MVHEEFDCQQGRDNEDSYSVDHSGDKKKWCLKATHPFPPLIRALLASNSHCMIDGSACFPELSVFMTIWLDYSKRCRRLRLYLLQHEVNKQHLCNNWSG